MNCLEEFQKSKNISFCNSFKDGLINFNTILNVKSGEIVKVFDPMNPDLKCQALIMNLTPVYCEALVLEDMSVKEGWMVSSTEQLGNIKAGLHLFNTVVNALGENMLTEGNNSHVLSFSFSMETRAPNILDRQSVHQPLHSGLKAIDSLIPIGLGQRELIIGDRQTGKTTIGFDLWYNQNNLNNFLDKVYNYSEVKYSLNYFKNVIWVIYVAIGQKRSKVMSIFHQAKALNMMQFSCIVAATAAESAPMQFLAPYTACALGEYIRDIMSGHSVLIYDDLSKHAVAYRQMSLLLRRPPGREAFPGDVFYIHSRLLERAAKLSLEYKLGSLTALPIIETQAGDVSAYIPTNVISITDGQIFLETDLFYAGIRPAINAGLSVSRVGSAAQLRAMKQIAGSLKLELAQFREVESFSKLGATLDTTTQSFITRGYILIEILKQSQTAPCLVPLQLITLFAGLSGYLDFFELNEIECFLTMLEYIFFNNGLWYLFERFVGVSILYEDLHFFNVLYVGLTHKIKNCIVENVE